jgi:hypothetical protein
LQTCASCVEKCGALRRVTTLRPTRALRLELAMRNSFEVSAASRRTIVPKPAVLPIHPSRHNRLGVYCPSNKIRRSPSRLRYFRGTGCGRRITGVFWGSDDVD